MINKNKKYRIFFDMDGVICDFEKSCKEKKLSPDEFKHMKGAYLNLEPYPDAIDNIKKLIKLEKIYNFEVWIATKPPTGSSHAYSEKAEWIYNHLPELKRRIIITHNKGLLGGENDFLIDDRPHKANIDEFLGEVLHYGSNDMKDWEDVMEHLLFCIESRSL